MLDMPKSQIIGALNGTSPYNRLEPQGVVENKTIELPIQLVLAAIMKQSGLKAGIDCAVIDYIVGGNSVQVKVLKGEFKVITKVPDAVAELFAQGAGTNEFRD